MTPNSGLFADIETHLLHDPKPSQFLGRICSLAEFGQYPFGMLKSLQTTEQSPRYHAEGNVWNHTVMVVDEAAKVRDRSENPRVFMWAALLHDIGKPSTTKNRKGKITSYEHEAVGAGLAGDFLREFSQDGAFIEGVCNLIRYHMQILFVLKELPFAAVEGMKKHVRISELALFCLCDRLGRAGADRRTEEANVREFIRKCGGKKEG